MTTGEAGERCSPLDQQRWDNLWAESLPNLMEVTGATYEPA